jgi:putative pyoverdin transport system ATP-binding/permease protein
VGANGGSDPRATAAFVAPGVAGARPRAAAQGGLGRGIVVMSFFQLVRSERQGSLRKLLLMSSLGGVSSAAILAAINAGAQAADRGQKGSLWALALFVVALYLFMKTQIYVTTTITGEIEAVIHRIRVRLLDHIRHSELSAVDRIGRSRIIAAITGDTVILTQASNTLCYSIQAPILIVFVATYIAYLSIVAFALSAVIVSIAGIIFDFKSRQLTKQRATAMEQERRLFDRLSDFLDGFKEVRLHAGRSDDLFDDAVEVSRAAANIKISAQAETFKLIASAQCYMYLLLAGVVFIAPMLSDSLSGGAVTKTTTALLFIIGACFGLVQSIPILLNANSAADRLAKLETDFHATVSTDSVPTSVPKRFDKIEMHNVVFRYSDSSSDTTFRIGPLDFTLRSGELVFITGGNGSGKSTLLMLLAGLYPPDSGEIALDGVRVDDGNRDEYRSLISGIFFDYHLFRRLYGIRDPNPVEVDRLLHQFRLENKTGLSDGEFRTLELSGGQRRRLALIVSLLEKRPIMLLDEWTAEQDPEFRRKFYEELLPAMMQAGATVVVITHDDRYLDELDLAARRIRMDEGHIVDQGSI